VRGKVARRNRQAVRRTQENNRLARKAASVERSQHEREFDRAMHELRVERADAMKAANAEFEKALKKLETTCKEAVQAADQAYIEKRDAIVKRLAREQEKTS
jgi:hypothetical protein